MENSNHRCISERESCGSSFAIGHNQLGSKDMYERYSQNIRMRDSEVKRQEELLTLGVSTSKAALLLREERGKPFTSKNVHNERKRIKERVRDAGADLEKIMDIVAKFKLKLPPIKYKMRPRHSSLEDPELQNAKSGRRAEGDLLNLEFSHILLPGVLGAPDTAFYTFMSYEFFL